MQGPGLFPSQSAIYVVQRKGRRWPHAMPALTVASYEAIGLLWLVSLRPFPPNWEAGGSAQATLRELRVCLRQMMLKEMTEILAYSLKWSQCLERFLILWTMSGVSTDASIGWDKKEVPQVPRCNPFYTKRWCHNYAYIGTLCTRWQVTNWGFWLDNIPTQPTRVSVSPPHLAQNQIRQEASLSVHYDA